MTPAQQRGLDFIRGSIERRGIAPTYREISAGIGTSEPGALRIARALERDGYLRIRKGKARGIELADRIDLSPVKTVDLLAELDRRGVTPGVLEKRGPASMSGRVARCSCDLCPETVEYGHPFCRPHWWIISRETQRELKAANFAARRAPGDVAAVRRYQDAFTQAKHEAEIGRRAA